ncbi:TerB family tellurite resistance protein [Adhaeribacter sp. BT258]|uniref:TerB family tellurite resistance protein n=1 Tax=Adhaeribacter terrigena TaxID=2793070 RepID=A0ABS1C6J5_9BACT|nr:TerB family tellurite resistance protein [Adhaeribacter terrigena]MBK0404948.1 TerB family tellurite resistance protein [Adhaeribacter terrigena]
MENQEVQLLKDYSDTEKGAYLGAIASIASADHDASEQELQFLSALSKTAHLSSESEQAVLGVAKDPSNINVQRCLDVLKGSDLRYTFITDIMSFAKADGNLTGEEEELIKGMADYLGVNQQQYGVLKQFVEVADESARKGEVVAPQALGATAQTGGGGFDEMLKKVGIPSSGLMKGVLAIAAPILISQILRGGRRGGGMMGGMGGLLGGGLLGGLLGNVMGGGMNRGGLGGMMGGGSTMGSGGGLGSVLGGLGGLMGGSRRGMGGGILGGGLGSILGNVLGGRRAGW